MAHYSTWGIFVKDELLIVGDLAGNFNALERLLSQVNTDIFILAVGDVIDKGPDSMKLLNFFMEKENSRILLGNHEFLMLQTVNEIATANSIHDLDWAHIWIQSKGMATIESFLNRSIAGTEDLWASLKEFNEHTREQGFIDFLLACPVIYHQKGLIVSHAPCSLKWLPKLLKRRGIKDETIWVGFHPFSKKPWLQHGQSVFPLDEQLSKKFPKLLFCRSKPIPIKNHLHIFGHMSRWGYKKFNADHKDHHGNICIDTSRRGVLTGMLWPSAHLVSTKL